MTRRTTLSFLLFFLLLGERAFAQSELPLEQSEQASSPQRLEATAEAFPGIRDRALRLGEELLALQRPDGSLAERFPAGIGEPVAEADLYQSAAMVREWLRLVELQGGKGPFLPAAERSLRFLLRHGRGLSQTEGGETATALVASSGVARLGAAALALLALQDFAAVTGETAVADPMAVLAAFLTRQQGPQGGFNTWFLFDGAARPPYEPLGDPALAVLALLRHRRAVEPERAQFWIVSAQRGAGWLMGVRDLGKTYDRLPEDLALMRALDALHEISGGGRTYYLHARRMTEGVLLRRRRSPPTEPAPCSSAHSDRLALVATMVRIARRAEVEEGPYRQALEELWREQAECRSRTLRSGRHRLSAWLDLATLEDSASPLAWPAVGR